MKTLRSLAFAILVLASYTSHSQSFTNASGLTGSTFNSGGCVGVTDMNDDGLDDIIVLHNSRFLKILYQTPNGYVLSELNTVSSSSQWGMAIGDIANDGHRDVLCGGNFDGTHFVQIDALGQSNMVNLTNGSLFMQGCNVVDIDNDGHLDFFACHDVGLSRMWQNDGSGNLNTGNNLIDLTSYDPGTFTNTDHSGNYGSVWSDIDDDGDLDLVIAKCRQGVTNPLDPRRINQAWINDGENNYSEDGLDRGLVVYEQSWTADFADVNNDGFFDCLITTHSNTIKLLMNDGTGHFTDVTAAAGLAVSGFFLQAKLADFDNDGFVDLIYSGGTHRYYKNNGNGTFTHLTNMFPYSDTMHSFGIGDLNHDGFLDLYSSYGNSYVSPDANNPDILWTNNGNNNHWVAFDLEGTISNRDAVGAKVKIYGPWGVQVREIRAGESYGIVNSFHLHFGIGQNTSIDQAVIQWPSGLETVIDNPAIDTYHQIIEAPCQIAAVQISSSGSTTLCTGEEVMLSAPEGLFYQWNTGATTQSITVNTSGVYSLTVSDAEGCAGYSNTIEIALIEPVQPLITSEAELDFCQGGFVQLTASPGTAYTWSNGQTDQSILVSVAGDYSVAVTDLCTSALVSEPVEVIVYPAPVPQVLSPLILPAGVDQNLEVTGDQVSWYANFGDVEAIATGNLLNVNITEPTSFWVENEVTFGGETASGGKLTTTANGGQYHTNSSFWLLFDAHTDIILESVRVFADVTGSRTIALIDAQGNTLQSVSIDIPVGESVVDLNFFVPQGTGYGLRTVGSNPRLWRDGTPATLNYPYDLNGLATITSSTASGGNALAFYYFFYDWQVSTPSFSCVSERVEVALEVLNDPQGCSGDFNNDGLINIADLLLFLSEFGCNANCTADMDGDGYVGSGDLLSFLAVFSNTCE
jgi:hypothetical protein